MNSGVSYQQAGSRQSGAGQAYSEPTYADPVQRSRTCISVVIPHFNDLANLRRCLDSLSTQTLRPDQFEIILVDNASSVGLDAVRDVVNGKARVIVEPQPGAALARNAGVAASQFPIIAFLDSDCRPASDWLEQGLKAIAGADLVGGRMQILAEHPGQLRAVEAFEAVFAFQNETYVKKKGFSVTANLMVHRHVFEAVGEFRAGVSEDKEWCHRAISKGYSLVYAPEVLVQHPARRNWSELTRKWRRLNREEYGLLCQQPLGRWRWALRSWIVLVSPFGHCIRVLMSPGLHGARERCQAIAILFGIRLYRFGHAHYLLLKPKVASG